MTLWMIHMWGAYFSLAAFIVGYCYGEAVRSMENA